MYQDTGYRGIWYGCHETKDVWVYKYSGGLGTYCAKHIPVAVHAPAVNKTFFVYGGTPPGGGTLLECVSCFDHATGTVPRPTVLMDKKTTDAHDNPVLSIDGDGHLWVFASAHGTGRPAHTFRSTKPYDTADFEEVEETNYSYPQPWWMPGRGFLFLHTRYLGGRVLHSMTSPDGRAWSEPRVIAHIGQGHYQISWPCGPRVGTAFNHHPPETGLDFRTNLYYMETADMGASWQTVAGDPVEIPVVSPDTTALVRDYEAEGLNVYMKDINYDGDGRPVILHLLSKGWQPGPENGPRIWRTARWTGTEWEFRDVLESDNNYDTGCLHICKDGVWRVIGPGIAGPQPYNPGGEMVLWESADRGATWRLVRQITRGSAFNHTYARRPVNAHPGFFAFWADGHGRDPSESRLYFYDIGEDAVFRMPFEMEGDTARPERVREWEP
jgi:hypothetical protein